MIESPFLNIFISDIDNGNLTEMTILDYQDRHPDWLEELNFDQQLKILFSTFQKRLNMKSIEYDNFGSCSEIYGQIIDYVKIHYIYQEPLDWL